MRMIITLAAATALAGCTTVHQCPLSVINYSPSFEKDLAAEIKAAPPDAVWPLAILDYRHTRDAIKACRQ